MSKYAPANAEGKKPYVVSGRNFGRLIDRIVYAEDASAAKHWSGFVGVGNYVVRVRRATPQDLPRAAD